MLKIIKMVLGTAKGQRPLVAVYMLLLQICKTKLTNTTHTYMTMQCICCHYIYYIKYQAKWSNKRLFAFYKNTLFRKAIYKIGITPLHLSNNRIYYWFSRVFMFEKELLLKLYHISTALVDENGKAWEKNWTLQCELVLKHILSYNFTGNRVTVVGVAVPIAFYPTSEQQQSQLMSFTLLCASAENKILLRTRRGNQSVI